MNERTAFGRTLSALLVGAALGIALETGAALLLYSGLGMLSAAGFITGAALAALATGVWVGAPEPQRPHDEPAASFGRWMGAVIALMFAAIYATGWERISRLRLLPVGRALAVLLLVAWPAYALGALLATLDARARLAAGEATENVAMPLGRTGIAVAGIFGAAIGVAWAGIILIPRLPAAYVLGGCAAVLAAAATWETLHRPGIRD